ncbi:amidase [Rhizobiaceae bacterium n13]|uniref:Amidase n=1 Tax=Ferirhizobium litorale TaxID=2927786 RepID=A0AAE3QJM8_9HYPH|nr:amidase [Fererhizobium litorale]MDI7862712.1 amidase [Fererhizobium litorale]MDI7924424.1 amidase [Fererhizobium litorale]
MAADPSITAMEAVILRQRIATGSLTALEVAEAFLANVAEREPQVGAWAFLDAEYVLNQARSLDAYRGTGRPLGPLHGIPVGLKDIIDTSGMPTENGTVVDKARMPAKDAAVVRRLKAAGAVIMGKTKTTELAYLEPAVTRNPHHPDHTAGGSSVGSAAAVAAGMVPLAIGTQTGGSVVRPASYCGVVGYKPSFGMISRAGILAQSPSLDTVGVFARSMADAALLADVLCGDDPEDRSTVRAPPPQLLERAQSDAPVAPAFAFVRTPFWQSAEPGMQAGMEEVAALLGEHCFEAELPPAFGEALAIRETINLAEMSKCYHRYTLHGESSLSETIRRALKRGSEIPARDYIAALDWPDVLNAGLWAIFGRCDAILTPAAPGPAPADRGTTGPSTFNGMWTLCGLPTITLPILSDESGMPMGVQLVGRRGDDGRLLRTANWLLRFLGVPRREK